MKNFYKGQLLFHRPSCRYCVVIADSRQHYVTVNFGGYSRERKLVCKDVVTKTRTYANGKTETFTENREHFEPQFDFLGKYITVEKLERINSEDLVKPFFLGTIKR